MGVGAAVGIGKVLLGGASIVGLFYALAGATEKPRKDKDLELDPDDPTKGGGGKELLSCTQALGMLPTEMQTAANLLLSAPRTAENVAAMNKLAMSFDAAAAQPGFAAVKDALLVTAQCLRSYASTGQVEKPKGGGPVGEPPIIDENGVASSWGSDVAVKGLQSSPNFQWLHAVKTGESAWAIATAVFGSSVPVSRVVELIQYNSTKATKGDPNNPVSSGYNWVSLLPEERIKLPKTWNPWIDQQGYRRGGPTPWPKPSGVGA